MTRPFALGALAALAVFSLSSNAVRSAPAPPAVADAVFTDSTAPIAVVKGQLFLITLAANPTTGYHWKVSTPTGAVAYKGSAFRAPKTGLMGAPGDEFFVFEAHAAGEATITFDYLSPGTAATVGKTVHFKVAVKKS